VTIKFNVKDGGRGALIQAISGILSQDAVYSGSPDSAYAAGGFIVKCSTKQKTMKGANTVNIRFNVRNGGRRAFANAIGEILGEDVIYNGTPAFTYTIGSYTVDREGALICPADADHDEADELIAALQERGYEAEKPPDYHSLNMTEREELGLGRERRDPLGEDGPHPSDIPESGDSDKLVIEISREHYSDMPIENLKKIIASKETLIKKALASDSLRIDVTDEKICFPWFTLTGISGEAEAYSHFIFALCEMARRQKHITAKEKPLENDKFTMRLFLIRLGFNGPEFKSARKILLRNLEGNSAFKNGKPEAEGCVMELACINCGHQFSGMRYYDGPRKYSPCPNCSTDFDVGGES
jgi:hypothetical protein